MLNFKETARLSLLGCKGMTAEAADKIMADCKMSVDMKDPFGFLQDSQRAGLKHGLDRSTFSDFNNLESKLMLSMALQSAAKVKDPVVVKHSFRPTQSYPNASLKDIKVGDTVRVAFTEAQHVVSSTKLNRFGFRTIGSADGWSYAGIDSDPIIIDQVAGKQADVPIELPIPVAPMQLSVPSVSRWFAYSRPAPVLSKFEVFSINAGEMLDFEADTLDNAVAKAKKLKEPCAIYSNSALVASYSPARGVTHV